MHIPFEQIPAVTLIRLFGLASPIISGITYNSQLVKPQFAFVAIMGENTDGHMYIKQAIELEASVIIGTDEDIFSQFSAQYPHVTFVLVEEAREAMAHVADYFYGNIQERLIKVGVTGTNGKTTVSTYVQHLFNLLHIPCGMLGTTGIWKANGKMDFDKSTPTTPMSADVHHIFHELHRTYHEAAAMEVSSIALDQKRVAGIQFDIAIHTNFSEEHLEYHKTMEHYKKSKLLLFQQAAVSIVNLDDVGMAEDILRSAPKQVITYSQNLLSNADLIWTDCRHHEQGMIYTIYYEEKKIYRICSAVW